MAIPRCWHVQRAASADGSVPSDHHASERGPPIPTNGSEQPLGAWQITSTWVAWDSPEGIETWTGRITRSRIVGGHFTGLVVWH